MTAPADGGRRPRYAVLGLGNRLQADEALGALTIERLAAEPPEPPGASVELIDGGTVGLGLLPYLEGLDGLVIVDAVEAARPPGTLLDLDGVELARHGTTLGVHDVGLRELLGALVLQGTLPRRVRVTGIVPARVALGTELSAVVSVALPALCAAIRRRLDVWAVEDG